MLLPQLPQLPPDWPPPRFYKLVDHETFECSQKEWGIWCAAQDVFDFHVNYTRVGELLISTIFLGGLDHGWGFTRTPRLFETMIFEQGEPTAFQRRCATWAEAEKQHQDALDLVKSWGNVALQDLAAAVLNRSRGHGRGGVGSRNRGLH